MGLFKRKRFVWYEPWFFQQRIRTTKAWVLFALLLLTIAVALGLTLFFAAKPGRPFHVIEMIGVSMGVAFCAWWVFDGANSRRQAILFEDSIVVGGDMGKYSSPTTYKLSKIPGAAIVMPEESKWPEPALFFIYDGEEEAIGIESKVGFRRLAQAIHDAGVPIRMEGWQPNEERAFEKAFSWEAPPGHVTEKARIETLPPGTPSMMNVSGMLLAIIRQCWALALWLLITVGAIYYGYVHWKNLGLLEVGLLFVIPIGAMWLAGDYTDRIGVASATHSLILMSKQQFRKRIGSPINVDADNLVPVEIFTRDQFANTVQKIREMGFIQVDPKGRQILFEGKKERWWIPVRSVRALTIEEVQTGTPGQSAMGGLNYYVVVKFSGDEEHEFGFRYGGRDYGAVDDVKRAEGAIRVFEAFESAVKDA